MEASYGPGERTVLVHVLYSYFFSSADCGARLALLLYGTRYWISGRWITPHPSLTCVLLAAETLTWQS